MFNPQSYAVSIELFLRPKGYALMGDADTIRKDPIAYLDIVLSRYEKQSEEHEKLALNYWDKYEKYKGKSIDELGADVTTHMISDFKELF